MLVYNIFEQLEKKSPLVLSVGSRVAAGTILTTMRSLKVKCFLSFDSREAEDIAESADSVLIDIVGIDDGRIAAGIAAAKVANRRKIPVIVDVNRVEATMYRAASFFKIMNEVHVSMVCGNIGDYEALIQQYETLNKLKKENDFSSIRQRLQEISRELQTTIVLSDEQCIVTDGDYISTVVNYDSILERIVGAENILVSTIAAFQTLENYDPITKALMACGAVNVSAEIVAKKYPNVGPSFGKMYLLDEIYALTSTDLVKHMEFTEE